MKKALDESAEDHCDVVYLLINARPDTIWWHSYVTRSTKVVFLKGRVKFLHGDSGKPVNSSTAPSCIVIFDRNANNTKPVFDHWDWRTYGEEYWKKWWKLENK